MTSVYLIASERSGTNLLRRHFTQHQNVYFGMSPAHLLKHLYYREPYYGDLNDNAIFKTYIQDAINLCKIHFSPWDIELDADEILEDYSDKRNSILFASYLMTRYAKEKGYQGYFCKDNFLWEFSLDVSRTLPNAKFIYLYRDPRDFVLSQMKRNHGHNSVIHFSKVWQYEQTRSIRVVKDLQEQGRCHSLSYEEFIQNPQDYIQDICTFLEVEYSDSADNKASDKIIDNVHEWKNLNSPIDSNNTQKFLTELSSKEVKIIESICAQQMNYLGYTPLHPPYKITPLDKGFDFLNLLFSKIKRAVILKFKENDTLQQRSQLLKKLSINYTKRG